MFLADKYAPKSINDLFFNLDIYYKLAHASLSDNMPHLIIHGPPGCGKKTIINRFLEMLFDEGVHKTMPVSYTVSSAGNNSKTVVISEQSDYHIIINPNNNNFDRYLIQDVIKEYARQIPLQEVFKTSRPFKVVLINNIENLSHYAQASLRRTMEQYSNTCRFVMWCRNLSKISEPLRSRCRIIRVPAPTESHMFRFLLNICMFEKVQLKLADYNEILKKSKRNIRKAMWLLELKLLGKRFNLKKKEFNGTDTETTFENVIEKITQMLMKPKASTWLDIRQLLYDVMVTNINGPGIINALLESLIKTVKDENKVFEIVKSAAVYEHRLLLARREIDHLEAFINSVIVILHT